MNDKEKIQAAINKVLPLYKDEIDKSGNEVRVVITEDEKGIAFSVIAGTVNRELSIRLSDDILLAIQNS